MSLDRAHAAQRLLADDAVKEAFAQIEADIMKAWLSEKTPEARDQFWHDISAVHRLRAKLKGFADELVMAKHKEAK